MHWHTDSLSTLYQRNQNKISTALYTIQGHKHQYIKPSRTLYHKQKSKKEEVYTQKEGCVKHKPSQMQLTRLEIT